MNAETLTSPNGALRVGEPGSSNTPDGLAILWLEHLRRLGRKPKTLRAYELTVFQWLRWAATNQVDPIEPALEDLEAFVDRPRLRQGHGGLGAPATRRGEVVHLRLWFKWMLARGLVKFDPTLDLGAPSVKARMPRPMPQEHWIRLRDTEMAPRLRLALGLAYFCGLRRGEITDLKGHQLTSTQILNFTRKGGSDDTLPWASMLATFVEHRPALAGNAEAWSSDLLEHARTCGPNLMFWRDGQQMYKDMKRACARAGIPHYTPHQLRASCATELCDMGVPIHIVSNMLAHSSLDMTRRYVKAGGSELDQWRKNQKLT